MFFPITCRNFTLQCEWTFINFRANLCLRQTVPLSNPPYLWPKYITFIRLATMTHCGHVSQRVRGDVDRWRCAHVTRQSWRCWLPIIALIRPIRGAAPPARSGTTSERLLACLQTLQTFWPLLHVLLSSLYLHTTAEIHHSLMQSIGYCV